MKSTSLTRRLLTGILLCIAIMWLTSAMLVWFEARHELAEIVEALPTHSENFKEIEEERTELLNKLLANLFAPLLLGLPIIGAAIAWIIWRATKPLRTLQAHILGRNHSDTSEIDTTAIPREVKPVVQALNTLMQRQEAQIQQERRFNADAAHELRTPLAVVRSYAEVAQLSQSASERTLALQKLVQASERAERLVSQLLALSRLERLEQDESLNQNALPPSLFNLVSLVRETMVEVADYSQTGPAINWQLRLLKDGLELEDLTLNVQTQADLLKVLLRNLLDNAARYAPCSAANPFNVTTLRCTVQLNTAANDRGEISILIEDSGAGMAQEDIAKLGQRFFRAHAESGSGSGLGWSIIERIAAVLGLTVQAAKSADLHGLAVTVQGLKAT